MEVGDVFGVVRLVLAEFTVDVGDILFELGCRECVYVGDDVVGY